MDDIMLINYLKSKGMNSNMSDHEFIASLKRLLDDGHKVEYKEDKAWNGPENKEYMDTYNKQNENHFDESYAKYIVSNMYHYESGTKFEGEKFCMETARETYYSYKNKIADSVTIADIYVAINAQYHDYSELLKSWFNCDINQKIIESAMTFWFMDNDYNHGSKIWNYFNVK